MITPKIKMIEIVWDLSNKVKQLRLQMEVHGITAKEDITLREIEEQIKEVQSCLLKSIPEKPHNYIWEHTAI